MKQIKVPLTPEQWAEKRLQLTCHSYELTYHPERFDSLLETCGFYLVEDEEQPETKPDEIPTDKVEAVFNKTKHPNALEYDDLIGDEYYLKCKKTLYMEDGDKAATRGYFYPSVERYNVFAGELSEAGCLDHQTDNEDFLNEYFEKYKHPNN